MNGSFKPILFALVPREWRAGGFRIPAVLLALCSAVAGWTMAVAGTRPGAPPPSWASSWMLTDICVIGAFTMLHTLRSVSNDMKAGWFAPLRAYGLTADHYAPALIVVCGGAAAFNYAMSTITFAAVLAIRGGLQPAAASASSNALMALPQGMMALVGMCGFAVVIALIVTDATWATVIAFVLLLGPSAYEIAHVIRHHVMPPPRTQLLMSLHVPPFSMKPDLRILLRLISYFGAIMLISTGISARRVGRYT